MQKSTFKLKGEIHATLRVKFNVLDPFLTNFLLFTLFFFFSTRALLRTLIKNEFILSHALLCFKNKGMDGPKTRLGKDSVD